MTKSATSASSSTSRIRRPMSGPQMQRQRAEHPNALPSSSPLSALCSPLLIVLISLFFHFDDLAILVEFHFQLFLFVGGDQQQLIADAGAHGDLLDFLDVGLGELRGQ